MADFTGGYTGAVNDAQRRRSEDALIQRTMQEIAVSQWAQKQREQQQRELMQDQARFGKAIQDQMPQPPMPGQGSQPMLPPMPPGQDAGGMMARLLQAPGATPPMFPQGAQPAMPQPPTGAPPAAAPSPAAGVRPATVNLSGVTPEQAQKMLETIQANRTPAPQGWQASPGASPQLGGQPPGQPPAAGPAGIPPPPGPPQMPMPKQGQGFTVMGTFRKMVDQGVPAGEAIRAIENNMPIIQAQNREELESLRAENQAVNAAFKAYKAEIDAFNARTKASDVGSKIESRDRRLRIQEAKQDSVAGKSIDEETLAYMADQYLAGDKSVAAGLGYGNVGAGNRAALRRVIMEKGKAAGLTGADIAARIAEYNGIMQSERTAGQRSAQVAIAASEANKMADIVLAQSKDFSRTEFRPINAVLAEVEKGGGGVAVRKYAAAINSFINAYARAIAPTGVATVSDKDHAREILSLADSEDQLEGIIDVMKQEMGAAMAAPKEARASIRSEVGATAHPPKAGELPAGWTVKER